MSIPGFRGSWGAWARLWAAALIKGNGPESLCLVSKPDGNRGKARRALLKLAESLLREAERLQRLRDKRAGELEGGR